MNSIQFDEIRQTIGATLIGGCLGMSAPGDTTSGLMFSRQESKCAIRGYHDEVLDLRDDIYNKPERKKDVNEEALDHLISRILFSATMNDEHQDYYGIANGYNGVLQHPDYMYRPACKGVDLEELDGRSSRASGKNERKGRGRRKSDPKRVPATVENCVVESHNPTEPHVYMPLSIYRRMLYAEIDSKAREIHQFYDFQYVKTSDEHASVLKDLVHSQENCRRLQGLLATANAETETCEKICTVLETKIEMLKMAKKRRRQAKKQRNTESVTVSISDITDATTRDTNIINSEESGDEP